MTDKPYRGRKGGRYVRASRDEEPRRVDEVASARPAKAAPETAEPTDDANSETPGSAPAAKAAKPARKRN